MLKFAANLTMMYGEYNFLDRFSASAKDGFTGIEYMFPYDFNVNHIKDRLVDNNLTQVLINAPAGDWEKGDRGLACLPNRQEDFYSSLMKALEYSQVLGNKLLHIMIGNRNPEVSYARQLAVLKNNLSLAAEKARSLDITIVIEAINRRDMPMFFMNKQDETQSICLELGYPNLKVLFDIYHCQVSEGDISKKLENDLPHIGHIQVASVPNRNEPDSGELNYSYIFSKLTSLNYQGWIGCEYRPAKGTTDGLGWIKNLNMN
ncbi:hydroxypyruvate isomerase [Gilliamella sp. wkB178]|uniref:2-oxo-tetronate isomerase n=1 Tax=Gilliamella sp. wkB178 TaxID=3120259 RepID=UPI00080E5760|nr:2-oxo-tetronate isomerase [Gilliamella apicola]OCG07497.1 hydroxypyruvate isomerase [Gilliamella apicola]